VTPVLACIDEGLCSATAAMLQQQCYSSSATAAVPQQQCCQCRATAAVLQQQCYSSSATAAVPQQVECMTTDPEIKGSIFSY